MNWTEAHYEHWLKNQGVVLLPKEAPKPTGTLRTKTWNKTEAAYGQYLTWLQRAGEVLYWDFEVIKVKIGHDCWFHPDFLVMYKDFHLELHDTKGRGKSGPRAQDDAIVKARSIGKQAAQPFPIPIYFVWQEQTGEWSKREM